MSHPHPSNSHVGCEEHWVPLHAIFAFLTPRELSECRRVVRTWYHPASSNSLWRSLAASRWNLRLSAKPGMEKRKHTAASEPPRLHRSAAHENASQPSEDGTPLADHVGSIGPASRTAVSSVLSCGDAEPLVLHVHPGAPSTRTEALRWYHHYAAWSIDKRMPNGRFATPLTLVFSRADVKLAPPQLTETRPTPHTSILRGWLGVLHMDDTRLPSASLYGQNSVFDVPHDFGRRSTVATPEAGHVHAPGSRCQSCEMREHLLRQGGVRNFVDKFKSAPDTASVCGLCQPSVAPSTTSSPHDHLLSATAFKGKAPIGAPREARECSSVLMLKVILQHVAYSTPSTQRVLVLFHEIAVSMKDGTIHANQPVLSKHAILALNGHEYAPGEGEAGLGEDATGVSLAPDGNCVIRVAIDLSTGSGDDMKQEPECLEAMAAVSIVVRDAACPHTKLGTLVLPMDTPGTEAGVWKAYRAVPGGRFTRLDRDEESLNLGCVLLCGPT